MFVVLLTRQTEQLSDICSINFNSIKAAKAGLLPSYK